MLTNQDLEKIISECSYSNWNIELRFGTIALYGDPPRDPYVQIRNKNGVCSVTGKPMEWTGRKWKLSYHMVPNEVVRTVFKAVEAAVIHELLEEFKFMDQPIFNPHVNPYKMAEFVSNPDNLQERTDVQFGV